MKSFLSLTIAVSLFLGQFAAPFNSPLAQEPDTTETAVQSPTPSATPDVSETPTVEPTSISPTETAVPVQETPVSTATPAPEIVDAPALSLRANPEYVTSGAEMILSWEIQEESLTVQELVLQITLPDGFSLQGGNEGKFDETSRMLSIPVMYQSGEVHLLAADLSGDVVFYAALLENDQVVAETKLLVPVKEKFTLDDKGGVVEADEGRIKIEFPQDALLEASSIEIGTPSGDAVPPYSLTGNPFEVKAFGEQSKEEQSQFSKEISISVSYADLGIPENEEGNLYLFWYDPEIEAWVTLDSYADSETKTIHATTNHFTVFDIGVDNWQASHLPTIEAFQTSIFTGAATYSMPIEVPAGSGGLQPNLSLNYNSQIVDNSTTGTQASWVGMGWSLDTGFIERNAHGTNSDSSDDTYSLSVNGISVTLAQDANGVYHALDENYWKVQRPSSAKWIIKDKTGNVYTFEDEVTMSYNNGSGQTTMLYRWGLTSVENIFGQKIEYTYTLQPFGSSAYSAIYPNTISYANGRYRIRFETQARTDYPIEWDTSGTFHSYEKSRLKNLYVEQDVNGNGTNFALIRKYQFKYVDEGSPNNVNIFPGYPWSAGALTSTLAEVKQYGSDGVTSLPAASFMYDGLHLTRAENGYGGAVEFDYELWYDWTYPAYSRPFAPMARTKYHHFGYTPYPCYQGSPVSWEKRAPTDIVGCDGGRLLVRGTAVNSTMVRSGNRDLVRPGGVYQITAGFSKDAGITSVSIGLNTGAADDMETAVTNTPYIYELPVDASHAYSVLQAPGSSGNHARFTYFKYELLTSVYRVTQRRVEDGNGHTYTYGYTYEGAAVNDPAHSAGAAACEFTMDSYGEVTEEPGCNEYYGRFSEFRGHHLVTETAPDGTQTITEFHQDDILKGRPIKVTVKNGSLIRQESTYSYFTSAPLSLSLSGYDDRKRYWVYTSSVENRIYDTSGAYTAAQTTYTYESTYGNLTSQSQTLNGALYRTTTTDYYPLNNGTLYLVGLPARQQVKNAAGTVIAESLNIYDSNTTYNTAPTAGKLTAMRTWVDGALTSGRYNQASFGYDTWGNQTTVTTYSGYGTATVAPTVGAATMTVAYDSAYHVYPVSSTNPLGQVINWTYDYTLGVPLTETDANGSQTSAVYDVFGRMTKLICPGDDSTNPTISIAYTNSFPFTTTLTQKIDATQSYTVQRKYDGIGRQTQIISGGTIVDTLYDSPTVTRQSVPYTGTSPNLFSTSTVNPAAQTVTMTAPDGTFTTTYANGLTTTFTDARGNVTTSLSDVFGRVVSVTPPTAPGVIYTYDEFNRLKTAVRGGVTTTLNYDAAGRKINMTDPDMGYWVYGYNALGNLTSQTDARGCVLTLGYDSLSRLSTKTSSGAGCVTQVNTTYTYDAGLNGMGRRTSMTDASGTAVWEYDTRGRAKKETKTLTGNPSYITQWTYNSADLPLTMTYPDGEVVTNNYTSRMLLNSVIGTNNYVQSTTYDSAGRMTNRALGNGLTQNYAYFAWNTQGGRLDKMVTGSGTWDALNFNFANNIQKMTYAYDNVGNLTGITNPLANETNTYGYDVLNRLTSWNLNGTTESYTYNASTGNLETKAGMTLQYNDAAHKHAVTNAGGNSYQYDANGNQTTRVIGSDTFNLIYDAENRLTEVKKNNSTIAQFTYDGDGRQVKSVVNGVTTLFVGAHYNVENGVVVKYYFAGAQRVAVRKNGTLSYILSDHLGSTTMITNTTGTVIGGSLYKAWGETRYTLGSIPTNYKYTGQREESSFGLYFYNARWYDPAVGRFAQADTIVPRGIQGLDRYGYANNSPLNYVDPTGHFTVDAIKNYLKGYCEQEKACYDTVLEQWQGDKDWWDMLLAAQAGDKLFGISTFTNDGGQSQFEYTFMGQGNDILSGILLTGNSNSISGAPTNASLIDIQAGFKDFGSGVGSSLNWMGFYRTDNNGKPSFWVRPGYKLEQTIFESWASKGADVAAGTGIGGFVGLISGYWWVAGVGFVSGMALPTASDVLNMEPYDVNVQIGPVRFNFQLTPGGKWILEDSP